MIIHRLQPLFSEDIRESLGNASVSVELRDYMQTFQIALEIFTFALNPFQGSSAFFNAVSSLPVDVHGSLLAFADLLSGARMAQWCNRLQALWPGFASWTQGPFLEAPGNYRAR